MEGSRSLFELPLLPRKLSAALRDAGDAKPNVRLSAIVDLSRHARAGEEQAGEGLRRLLTDEVEEVRAAAALALADAGVSGAVDALLAVAEGDASSRVRQMALLALGELAPPGTTAVIEVLLRASRASEAAERFQALLALHQLRAERSEQVLIEGMVDPDAEVRRLSFRVAEAHFADRALPELVRARARSALSDSRPGVRSAAALLLGHFGDTSGQQALLALIAGEVRAATPEDEQAAMEIAATLPLLEARPLLEKRARALFGRDALGFHARVALARMGDERARAEILRGLGAWTFARRTLAVIAAGRAGLVGARERIRELARDPMRVDPASAREALALLDAEAARHGAESPS